MSAMKSLDELNDASLYLDSNVFIYAFEAVTGPLRQSIGLLLRRIYAGQCTAGTSLIARCEVLVRPLHLRQTELADRYRELLSGAGAVTVHGLDEATVDFAAELRADYPVLKLPDALHLATAIKIGCDVFVTGDRKLDVVSARISVLPLERLPAA
jgi:predicted nucleic acid-binding protein